MYVVTIIHTETGVTLDTLFSDQWGSLKATLAAANRIIDSRPEPCRVDYRIMGCL